MKNLRILGAVNPSGIAKVVYSPLCKNLNQGQFVTLVMEYTRLNLRLGRPDIKEGERNAINDRIYTIQESYSNELPFIEGAQMTYLEVLEDRRSELSWREAFQLVI